MEYNFAPPSVRRDIGILGLLHKRILGKSHPVFQKLLPFHDVVGVSRPNKHTRQLYGHILNVHLSLYFLQSSLDSIISENRDYLSEETKIILTKQNF